MNTHKNARLTYLRRLEMVQGDHRTRPFCLAGGRRAWRERRDGPQVAPGAIWPRALRACATSPRARPARRAPSRRPPRWRSWSCAASSSFRPASPPTWASRRRRSAGCCAAPGSRGWATCNRRSRPALRARDARRAAAHRHQEAWPLQSGPAIGSPVTAPGHPRHRLGIPVRRHR